MVRWIGILFATCLVIAASAQSVVGDRHLYPERLHTDIEMLRNALHEAHPDPYRYHTRSELDALIDAVRDSITVPMDIVEFQRKVSTVLKAVGDSHCYAEWPPEFAARLRSVAWLLPLQIRILPDGVYIEEELKGFRSIPLGSRLEKINGRPIDEIVSTLAATVVTDGANQTYAFRVVEREFPQLYHLYIEQPGSFLVSYRTPEKEYGNQVVFAMTGAEIQQTRKPNGASLLPWGSTWDPERSVVWITMRTLDVDSLGRAGQRPDRFLQGVLAEAKRNKARTMVIDLRGADGGELAMAELVFASIAKTPFRLLNDMIVRSVSPPETRPAYQVPSDFYASANARFLVGGQGVYRVPVSDDRLAEHLPMDRAFQGKVYILCDGRTRDAAAYVVMVARRQRRARIVGEETGTNAFGSTGGAEWIVTGTGSGMRFHIPLLKYVPAGRGEGPMDRGEQPNHPAYQVPDGLARGYDSIRASLLELISELE
jgi:hypothetical protein